MIIEAQDEDICEMCGDLAELRPYGPNGERVCFKCGMKNEEACELALNKRLLVEAERIN